MLAFCSKPGGDDVLPHWLGSGSVVSVQLASLKRIGTRKLGEGKGSLLQGKEGRCSMPSTSWKRARGPCVNKDFTRWRGLEHLHNGLLSWGR